MRLKGGRKRRVRKKREYCQGGESLRLTEEEEEEEEGKEEGERDAWLKYI